MKKIREELDSNSDKSDSESSEDSENSEYKVDFSSKQSKKYAKKQIGIMSLKFMQKAEQKKKEALKV